MVSSPPPHGPQTLDPRDHASHCLLAQCRLTLMQEDHSEAASTVHPHACTCVTTDRFVKSSRCNISESSWPAWSEGARGVTEDLTWPRGYSSAAPFPASITGGHSTNWVRWVRRCRSRKSRPSQVERSIRPGHLEGISLVSLWILVVHILSNGWACMALSGLNNSGALSDVPVGVPGLWPRSHPPGSRHPADRAATCRLHMHTEARDRVETSWLDITLEQAKTPGGHSTSLTASQGPAASSLVFERKLAVDVPKGLGLPRSSPALPDLPCCCAPRCPRCAPVVGALPPAHSWTACCLGCRFCFPPPPVEPVGVVATVTPWLVLGPVPWLWW